MSTRRVIDKAPRSEPSVDFIWRSRKEERKSRCRSNARESRIVKQDKEVNCCAAKNISVAPSHLLASVHCISRRNIWKCPAPILTGFRYIVEHLKMRDTHLTFFLLTRFLERLEVETNKNERRFEEYSERNARAFNCVLFSLFLVALQCIQSLSRSTGERHFHASPCQRFFTFVSSFRNGLLVRCRRSNDN